MKIVTAFTLSLPLAGALALSNQAISQWINLTDITIGARQEHSVVSVGTNVYIVGGVIPNSNRSVEPTTNVVQSYSITLQQWRIEAPLPIPLNHANVATVEGKIYVLGGLTGGPGVWPNWIANGKSYVYNPRLNEWSSLPSLPAGTDRGSAAVGVYRDSIYLAAGASLLAIGGRRSVDTVNAFNTRTQTWTTLPPLPATLDHSGGAVIGSTFYVVGGRINGSAALNVNTVYALDLTRRLPVWQRKSDIPSPRGGHATAIFGKKIYIFGGEGNPANPQTGVYNDVNVYDTESDQWAILPPWSIPRHGTAAATVNGKIYIPGGGLVQAFGPTAHFDAFIP